MHKNKKILLIVIVAVLVVGASAVGAYVLTSRSSQPPSADNPITTENTRVEDEDQPITDGQSPEEDKMITPTAPAEPSANIEKPNLTRAELSGDYIRVAAIFSNATNGTCVLTISKSDQASIIKSAQIIVGPSYYTCNGFRVPRSELPVAGDWQVKVSHQSNGSSVDSDSRTINVQ